MTEDKKAAFILHRKGGVGVFFNKKHYTEGSFFHETWGLTLLSFFPGAVGATGTERT
jgi:hypothetical protein